METDIDKCSGLDSHTIDRPCRCHRQPRRYRRPLTSPTVCARKGLLTRKILRCENEDCDERICILHTGSSCGPDINAEATDSGARRVEIYQRDQTSSTTVVTQADWAPTQPGHRHNPPRKQLRNWLLCFCFRTFQRHAQCGFEANTFLKRCINF